jgi:methanogenic corrinoid protein MtbC1
VIRWCAYCQSFLGESRPYDNPAMTHGICDPCGVKLERGESLKANTEPVRALFRRIIASAKVGDESSCADILVEARALGLRNDSILVGMLQPALYQAGLDWQGARMSVAAEHRFTGWCEHTFGLLAQVRRREAPIDMLILQTPGNVHTVGPRFVALALEARGMSVEAVGKVVPFEDMVGLVRKLQPRIVGFSCALPGVVPVAMELIVRLRATLGPELPSQYVVSGYAFRRGGAAQPKVSPGVEVAYDLDSFLAAA